MPHTMTRRKSLFAFMMRVVCRSHFGQFFLPLYCRGRPIQAAPLIAVAPQLMQVRPPSLRRLVTATFQNGNRSPIPHRFIWIRVLKQRVSRLL